MLYNWMKSLIVYIILSGIVVNLAPGKNYRQYINLLMGLIIIIVIAEPLSYVFHISGGDLSDVLSNMEEYVENNNSSIMNDSVYNYYDMGLEAGIKYSVSENIIKVEAVRVITDDKNHIQKCTIVLGNDLGAVDEMTQNEVKKYISDVYNVDFDSIYIVRR